MSERNGTKTGKKNRLWYVIAAVGAAALISAAVFLYRHYRSPELPCGTAEVCFIDVGQGDCTLISACGKNILIDSGGEDAYGKVSQFLSARGAERLDLLIMTHPHSDHMGSMYRIAESFAVGGFMMPETGGLTPSLPQYGRLTEALEKRGVPVSFARPGTFVELGKDCRLEIIAPVGDYEDMNNYSIVMRFVYGSVRFLLTGDIESEAEKDILASGADIGADVIKVPHHGSGSSALKRFIQTVSPSYAVFSAGEGNEHGHPHENVVDLYRKCGAVIYRTDRNGTVFFTTDGVTLTVRTAG